VNVTALERIRCGRRANGYCCVVFEFSVSYRTIYNRFRPDPDEGGDGILVRDQSTHALASGFEHTNQVAVPSGSHLGGPRHTLHFFCGIYILCNLIFLVSCGLGGPPLVNPPIFNPPSGRYASALSVTLSDSIPDAAFYYTTDGTTPTINSTLYTGAISVTSSETIQAIGVIQGYASSAVSVATYNLLPVTATPVFSLAPVTYSSAQSVTISDATSGAAIYYTTDGTTPNLSSPQYAAPITVSSSTTIKAIAVASGYNVSPVAIASYTISLNMTATPSFGTPIDLATTESISISDATPNAIIYYTIDGTTPTTGSAQYSSAISITTTTTIKAIAQAPGDLVSAVATDTFGFIASGVWTWMNGSGGSEPWRGPFNAALDDSPQAPGVRTGSVSGSDISGNFLLFGGEGIDDTNTFGWFNELWRYDPGNNQWTMLTGSLGGYAAPVYGPQGQPGSQITPGAMLDGTGCSDSRGNFWVFGGGGTASGYSAGNLNNLWKFDSVTGEWAWMSGSQTSYPATVYGTQHSPAPGNAPGGRYGSVSWTDSNNNLWIFGGMEDNATVTLEHFLNELWEFHANTMEWSWEGGSKDASGIFVSQGSPSRTAFPGARFYPLAWNDSSGNLWLFGGEGMDGQGQVSLLNDLWEFNPLTGEWTWVSGSATGDQVAVYGTRGVPSRNNMPSGIADGLAWVDSAGNFWIFGGNAGDTTQSLVPGTDIVWQFNPRTAEWTWVNGTPTGNPQVNYGLLGIANTTNTPGNRWVAGYWIDHSGDMWFFGGLGEDSNNLEYYYQDLWRYQP
jgi:N-acetylneuraminic acid mutarotase